MSIHVARYDEWLHPVYQEAVEDFDINRNYTQLMVITEYTIDLEETACLPVAKHVVICTYGKKAETSSGILGSAG